MFRVMQDAEKAAQLRALLHLTPFAREEFAVGYEESEDPVERARRTIIRSHMGHGNTGVTQRAKTGFRSNSNRSGTTPAHDWLTYPDSIPAYIERLRGVVIENRPASDVLLRHDSPRTLHYVDPPYVHSTRGGAKRYAWEMNDAEHGELATVLRGLSGMVVLSGYDCELYSTLYGDWKRVSIQALADGARLREEVLWLSPSAASSQRLSLGLA